MPKTKQPNYRKADTILVIALHGDPRKFPTVTKALTYLKNYKDPHTTPPLDHYFLQITYTTGSNTNANMRNKEEAIAWLLRNTLHSRRAA